MQLRNLSILNIFSCIWRDWVHKRDRSFGMLVVREHFSIMDSHYWRFYWQRQRYGFI